MVGSAVRAGARPPLPQRSQDAWREDRAGRKAAVLRQRRVPVHHLSMKGGTTRMAKKMAKGGKKKGGKKR
jgi:hypothetical protein